MALHGVESRLNREQTKTRNRNRNEKYYGKQINDALHSNDFSSLV